MIYVYMLH